MQIYQLLMLSIEHQRTNNIMKDSTSSDLNHDLFCNKYCRDQLLIISTAQSHASIKCNSTTNISALLNHNAMKFNHVNIKSLHHWPTNMIQYNLINIKSLHHFIIQYHKCNIIKIDPLYTAAVRHRLFKSTWIGHMLLNQCSSHRVSPALAPDALENSHRVLLFPFRAHHTRPSAVTKWLRRGIKVHFLSPTQSHANYIMKHVSSMTIARAFELEGRDT